VTTSNYHLQQRVEHYGVSIVDAQAVVVLVHGRTITPEYMNEFVVQRLEIEKIAFVAPAAQGNTWFPKSFLEPLAENQIGIDFTLERLETIGADLLAKGVSPKKIIWCGFSQGASALCQFMASKPRRWGALIAFTGGLIGPPGTQWNIDGDFAGMPAYFCTSDVDPHVPEFRVKETAALFKSAGAEVKSEYFVGRPHEISDAEIAQAKSMILQVLATSI